ncbi:uncharacterized protein LOC143255807 isoform X1 [Tachypleus tridentatus]|uniref:uncharacterized protein LOC143255807 isoform X1 n=1 Tax=Tachypleus tridentatus TaxID=6853 RepID=UPI003FD51559
MKIFFVSLLLFCSFLRTQAVACKCLSYAMQDSKPKDLIAEFTYPVNLDCGDWIGEFECNDFCFDLFTEITNNGDLESIPPGEGEISVGQQACDTIQKDVENVRIGVFSKACGGNILDTGLRSLQNLCCKEGQFHSC